MIKTFIEGWIKNSKSKNKVKPVKKDIKNIASDHIHDKRGKKEILNDRYEIAGSGYMYTRDYFNKYNRMYPKTFLYEEEYATILYLDKAGLKTAWADTKPITHKHGASTPEDFKNKSSKSKLKRTNKWVIIKLMFMSYKMIQNIYN